MVGLPFADIIILVLIGTLAGFLASSLIRGKSYGVIGNTVVGVLGAFIGGYVLNLFHLHFVFVLGGTLGISFVGACLLVLLIKAFGERG
jgi:uncharacterized membrane protein YeaQ/YmgE (transglycosylase-associated protein family)